MSVAQGTIFDGKYHDVGKVRLLITNFGTLFPRGSVDTEELNCEYPPNSGEEHISEAGLWIGGITPDNDTLVSVTSSWNPFMTDYEFYASEEPWDTIWVIERGNTAHIPYWPGPYVAFSNQDFVCRYSDYSKAALANPDHKPLYIDVIQTSYAWSSVLLEDIIVLSFYVIPTRWDLKKVYFTYWVVPEIGLYCRNLDCYRPDDKALFYGKLNMGVGVDGPDGSDGQAISPIGFQIFPDMADKYLAADSISWTFKYGDNRYGPPGIVPRYDSEKYRELMAKGEIMENQADYEGTHFVLSFGPYNLNVGDTLSFKVAVVLGEGLDDLISNANGLLYPTDICPGPWGGPGPADAAHFQIQLFQNFPNPVKSASVIRYRLSDPENVSIDIYDATGRRIRSLINARREPGSHRVLIDALEYTSGVYFYRLRTQSGYRETKKMVIIK
ncbi:MAG: T9SS type A sorting domain-containing protein [FCB group bacterium]|nr:T9SS type A sorting domain-containing protein [FCB group bacterium]